MKTKLAMLLILAAGCSTVNAQRFSEKITKELQFEKPGNNTLMIFNISGNVTVTGTTGDKIIIEVEKIITAKTDARLEKGKSQVQLGIKDNVDTIMLYIDGLCNQFSRSGRMGKGNCNGNCNSNRGTNRWGYQWDNQRQHNDCREEFDHQMNFTIRVPVGINLYASTINDGDIIIDNIGGSVRADNINGNISLKKISGATNASTINGSVDLEYAQNPPKECRYYSLNGDINAWFRKGLTADLSFESFNGSLYTNVNDVQSKPVALIKRPAEEGIKFKVMGNQFLIGKGGVLLDFETFNGDVYLREAAN